ncbi:S8 family serine peptidase [Sphingobium sp. AN641]|uniref:S8 family serine peptidase n=1 Tax=Sphingobium sp. AN641 TaxID=3133443 RepID=UPI0030C57C88
MLKPLGLIASLLLMATSGSAQLLGSPRDGLNPLPAGVPRLLDQADDLIDRAGLDRLSPRALTRQLEAARLTRIADLIRRHRADIELDDRRQPARRGTILLTGADDATVAALRNAGYGVTAERIEGLDLPVIILAVPTGRPLATALQEVRRLAPGAEASADNLYLSSGTVTGMAAPLAHGVSVGDGAAGLIDGGVARHPAFTGAIEQRGFARGAPRATAHGTAVASLISGSGTIRGAAPGAPLLVADIYGDDPAGGGAFAIARALGWMASRRAPVVTMSLVGPDNPLLAGAIRLARERGVTIVAAVGNDGPAAPLAYPASYPGVLAVSGVNGRNRLLPEAGRAARVDFVAPAADMNAAAPAGGRVAVRGTSFAAPLVAGRLFALGGRAKLEAEAQDLGDKGPDSRYGHGLLCGTCRNKY